MTYLVRYGALLNPKNIKRLPKKDLRKIRKAIEKKLTEYPDVFGKPLKRSLRGHRSLRVEDYRVIFRIDGYDVLIVAIEHRSVVYGNLEKKFRM